MKRNISPTNHPNRTLFERVDSTQQGLSNKPKMAQFKSQEAKIKYPKDRAYMKNFYLNKGILYIADTKLNTPCHSKESEKNECANIIPEYS